MFFLLDQEGSFGSDHQLVADTKWQFEDYETDYCSHSLFPPYLGKVRFYLVLTYNWYKCDLLGAARCSRGQVTCLCQPSTPRKRRRCWPGTALTALTGVWNTSALARFATPSATTRAASPASWPASPSWRIPWRTGVTGGRRRSCCTPVTWRSCPEFAEVESTAVVRTAPAVKVRATVTLTGIVLELQSVARTTAPRTRSFSTDRKIIHNSYSHRNVSRISRKDFSWFNTFVTHQRMIIAIIHTKLLL